MGTTERKGDAMNATKTEPLAIEEIDAMNAQMRGMSYEQAQPLLGKIQAATRLGGSGVSVPSSDGTRRYIVRYEGWEDRYADTWSCTCPSRKTCKHIHRVASSTASDYAD